MGKYPEISKGSSKWAEIDLQNGQGEEGLEMDFFPQNFVSSIRWS